ncbi:MAG: mandelate racemase/muconate lactonizing enzyme family protein [Anaerolineales bacterium]|nr:mandelate racemase/muconate lactonizing enzyme family protein [Anaerolineales bacterium]
MRITDIKTYPLWVGRRNLLVVKVETDAGIYGLGESGLSFRELAVVGAIKHYREWLIGRDPLQRGRLWQEMYRSQYFEGGRVLLTAQSAIDIALHDIAGKALGVPVYQLLGGKQRDSVPCFATAPGETMEEMLNNARLLWEAGWRVIRATPLVPNRTDPNVFEPRESLAHTAEGMIRLRAMLGGAAVLGLDYHTRLSVAEAASFCQRLPSGTLDFLEEPIRDETPEAYTALRKLTNVPFAVGEEFSSKWAYLPFIEQHLTDFARVDVCNVGGLTEAMKVAGWAEAHYIDLMPHNPLGPVCTAATVHLAAATPNFAWLEARESPTEQIYGNEADALFPVRPTYVGSSIPVSDAPGLGVEFNEELAQTHTWHYFDPPHWRRTDGSVTNW